MKKYTVTVGGRDFPLLFSLGTMELLEDSIPGFDIVSVQETLSSTKGFLTCLYCLAQAGAQAEGKQLDVSREWFGVHCPASKTWIASATEAIVGAFVEGMEMESAEEDPDREVDVVLEEIKKKGSAGGSGSAKSSHTD